MRIIVMLLLASAQIVLNAATLPTRDQVFNSAVYSRPAISASGKWIASTGARDGKLRLYPMAGGTPMETGTPADFQGRWYRWAKGDRDALIIHGAINGRDAFYRFDAESGKLASVTGDEHQPSMSFGMPTNQYAFTYDRLQKGDSYQDLAPDGTLVDASKASAHLPGYLAADGRYLRIAPGPRGLDFLAGADAARRGAVNVLHEDMRMAGGLMSISNDGTAWILSSQDQDTMGLFSLDTASGARKAVFSAPVDIHAVSLDPATKTPDFVDYETTAPVRALLNQKVAADLKLLDSKGNGFATILDRSPNDRYWVVGYLHRDGTPRMASFDRTSKKIAPLPAAAYTYLDSPDWRVRPFSITRPDGVNVSGHVTLPRAGMCEKRSCPAVLMVHGGPGIRDKAAFNMDRYWMSSRGVAVITVNYLGSRGFGKKFMQMDQRQWAGAIPQDLNAALAHAIKSFPIDGKRVAAVGTSFGGFMALHLAGTGTPLRCVVVDSASTDIVKFADRLFAKYGEGSDILQRVGDTRVAADKAAMIAMSPSAMIDKLKAIPILHLHGGRDDITVQEDSQQFIDDMLAANPRYTFVGMAQAGHGLYPHRSQYYALAENFLGKCLDVPMQEITKTEAASMVDFKFKGGAVDHGAAPKAP